MGGGGGGGGILPDSSIADVLAAAEKRLRDMAQQASQILVVCEGGDRPKLDILLQQLGPITGVTIQVASSGQQPVAIDNLVAWANWVVVFTEDATDLQFLDRVVEACTLARKAGVHVKGNAAAKIPSRVGAYRWRSLSWPDFVALITPAP